MISGSNTSKLIRKICIHHKCVSRNSSFSADNAENICLSNFVVLPASYALYFSLQDIFHVKRFKLSVNQKTRRITRGSWGEVTSICPRPCSVKRIMNIIIIIVKIFLNFIDRASQYSSRWSEYLLLGKMIDSWEKIASDRI